MFKLEKYKTTASGSQKISKFDMVKDYFTMDNVHFWPNFQIPLHFEL
jgi:hypothetical protein